MPLPLISIVLCSYNGATFIGEQIQSLLQQTYCNVEIVISDDASTDGTQAILEEYKNHASFKIFFQNKTLGSIKNVEFALQQTSGAFIAFCDQDDIWLPQKIERLHAHIENNMLIYCDSELVNEKGQPLHKRLSQLRKMYSGSKTRGFVFSNVAWGHTILIARQLVAHLLPFPDGIAHDIWMAFKACTISGITYFDEPLTKYRQHAGSVTKTIAVKTGTRTEGKRYLDFKEKLHWIGVMRQHEQPEEQPFYNTLFNLYKRKAAGSFQWPLAFFLLRHLKSFYQFSQKGKSSQIVDAVKHARGVRG